MKTKILQIKKEIEYDFIAAIERWAQVMQERFSSTVSQSYEFAIDELISMNDNDFFDLLSASTITKLYHYIENSPDALRAELESIYKYISDRDFDYNFKAMENYYKNFIR